MRLLPYLCALLLGVGAALMAGCGNRSGLIPASNASDLSSQLSAVQQAVAAGDCGKATAAVSRARSAVDNLPGGVDARLKGRLHGGLGQLSSQAHRACSAPPATTTTTVPTTTTQSTTTPPTTSTKSTPTTPSTPTGTTTVPSTPAVPTPTDPGSGGGASPTIPSTDTGAAPPVPDPGGAAPGTGAPTTPGASPRAVPGGRPPVAGRVDGLRGRDHGGVHGYLP